MNVVAMRIRENLKFNMARQFDDLLKIDFRISKCRQAFRLRRLERGPELTCLADLTHSLTATTGSRLEHHRVSKLFGGCACRFKTVQGTGCAGYNRRAGFKSRTPGARFRAHYFHRFGCWADKDQARFRHGARELGILGKKAVTWMDCFGLRPFG